MDKFYIASKFFIPVECYIARLIPEGKFQIPAVGRRDKPFVLEVNDHHENMERTPGQSTPMQHRVTARSIAESIVRHGATSGPLMTEQCRPAIWICETPFAEDPKLAWTADEFNRNVRAQDVYANLLIEEAGRCHREGKQRPTELMHAAATYLGIKGQEWQAKILTAEVMNCPYCQEQVAKTTVRCPSCKEIVDAKAYKSLKDREEAILTGAAK